MSSPVPDRWSTLPSPPPRHVTTTAATPGRRRRATAAATPEPEGGEEEEEEVETPAKKRRGPAVGSAQKHTQLRKPTAVGRYYSEAVSKWEDGSVEQQRKLAHIGRIEETSAGEDCRPACARCERAGFGSSCRRYTATNMVAFRTNRCGRCVFNKKPCS